MTRLYPSKPLSRAKHNSTTESLSLKVGQTKRFTQKVSVKHLKLAAADAGIVLETRSVEGILIVKRIS